jgi:hypothetical protein
VRLRPNLGFPLRLAYDDVLRNRSSESITACDEGCGTAGRLATVSKASRLTYLFEPEQTETVHLMPNAVASGFATPLRRPADTPYADPFPFPPCVACTAVSAMV